MTRAWIVFLSLAVSVVAGCVSPDYPPRATQTLLVADDLEMSFVLPGEKWEFTQKAPGALIRHMIGHLRNEAAAAGMMPSTSQLEQVAERRLAINEGFVFNPDSGAYLMIDFRRLSAGENIPGKDDLVGSAQGAELILRNESGVGQVSSKIRRMRMPGSRLAYRTDIAYRQNGAPRSFVGIIGCTETYRFYLYFNDLHRDPMDAGQMEQFFNSLTIRRRQNR